MVYYVYILTNVFHTVLYVGVTNNIARRTGEHISGEHEGFTKKYGVHKLVYFEEYGSRNDAILREKQLKKWRRAKKDALIAEMNPKWRDLTEEL